MQNRGRANASSLLSEFHELTKDDIENIKEHDYRANCPRFKALLGFNEYADQEGPVYPLIPPILSRGGTGRLEDLFQNPIHRKVCQLSTTTQI